MLDRHGEILTLLKGLKIDKNTLVIFAVIMAGPTIFPAKNIHEVLTRPTNTRSPSRSIANRRGELYEGGLRVPFVADWPGRIPPGGRTDFLGYFLMSSPHPQSWPQPNHHPGSKAYPS